MAPERRTTIRRGRHLVVAALGVTLVSPAAAQEFRPTLPQAVSEPGRAQAELGTRDPGQPHHEAGEGRRRSQVLKVLETLKPGETMHVSVLRDGRVVELQTPMDRAMRPR